MLCAHTVRRLKPDTYDDFKAAFMPGAEEAPAGWVRFHMLRSLADPNEIVTFGFYDGTREDLEAGQADSDFEERRDSVSQYVDAVIANGIYDVDVSLEIESAG